MALTVDLTFVFILIRSEIDLNELSKTYGLSLFWSKMKYRFNTLTISLSVNVNLKGKLIN
jgi:hypothetical protein